MACLFESDTCVAGSNLNGGTAATLHAPTNPERRPVSHNETVSTAAILHAGVSGVNAVDSAEIPPAPIDVAINILVDKGIFLATYMAFVRLLI
jgi:hypothetical protein